MILSYTKYVIIGDKYFILKGCADANNQYEWVCQAKDSLEWTTSKSTQVD